MKLFLTSLASATLDLLVPYLPQPPSQLSVVYITTAADPYPADNRPWFNGNRQKLIDLGFDVTDYDIKNKTESELTQQLSPYDIIYVEGGNVYYLLQHMRQTGMDIVLPRLLQAGKIYIGSSAGSVVLSPTTEHALMFDSIQAAPGLKDLRGLSLIKSLILPHSGKPKYAEREKDTILKWGDRLTLLRDEQALLVNGSKIELLTNN